MWQREHPVESAARNAISAARSLIVLAAMLASLFAGCNRSPNESPASPTADRHQPTGAEVFSNLLSLNLTNSPLTSGQVAAIQSNLTVLAALGTNSIPAIKDFLGRNVDVYFDDPANATTLGAPSLRVALLQQIAKLAPPASLELLGQLLLATADPKEIATVARALQTVEPEKYRPEILGAVRETLTLAGTARWDGRDVAPLFEIMVSLGADPEEIVGYAPRWFGYVPVTLLALPDGKGIPVLIKLAEDANGRLTVGRELAQRSLAEAAFSNPSAADVLQNLAHYGRIAAGAWTGVGAALRGRRLQLSSPATELISAANDSSVYSYHLSSGNQNLLDLPPDSKMPKSEIGGRIQLIDRLLDGMNDPAALDALEGARIELSRRLSQIQ